MKCKAHGSYKRQKVGKKNYTIIWVATENKANICFLWSFCSSLQEVRMQNYI